MHKIAFVIDTVRSLNYGPEKQLFFLIKNINREKFTPYLCVLYSSEWLEKEFDLCPVYIVGIKSFKDPRSYFQIPRFAEFLKKEGIDIVQIYFVDSNIVGIFTARIANVKTIISAIRGPEHLCGGKIKFMAIRFLNRWVDLFIVNSYTLKKQLMDIEGIAENRVQVIYNGVDPGFLRNVPPDEKEKYRKLLNIPVGSHVVGVLAYTRPIKTLDVFLEAAKLVKNELPETTFVIIGGGEEKERLRLRRLSDELGIGDSVKFLGERDDVVPILSVFDVGVLSSFSESFPNAILEYMAAGLPVVCTDVGDCREMIENGVNGFIVPPGDYKNMAHYIIKIIKEKELSRSMAIKNKETVSEKFSVRKSTSSYEMAYSGII